MYLVSAAVVDKEAVRQQKPGPRSHVEDTPFTLRVIFYELPRSTVGHRTAVELYVRW